MSLLKTIKIKNGDTCNLFNIYICDISGEEIPENFPYFSFKNNTFHISEKGIEKLIIEFATMYRICPGVYPYYLHNLLDLFTSKKVRSTYLNKEIKKEVLEKYKHTCQKCGSKDRLEIDHIIPVSKGGRDCISNLQILCKTCNVKKGNSL